MKADQTLVVITDKKGEVKHFSRWTNGDIKSQVVTRGCTETELITQICQALDITRRDLLLHMPSDEIVDLGDV